MAKYVTILLLSFILRDGLKGQDTLRVDTSYLLKEVIVTYQADKLTPITFQNIFSKELRSKSTGQEPSFLFSETPSITNYSDAGSSQGYSYLRLRGIDQTRINMTYDGVPLNEPEDQGAYFSNQPDILNSVSKIQIQRGVGTSKNGVASYGGCIQLFSPNLADSSRTTFGLGYGSFNSMRMFGEYNSGIRDNKAVYVRASQVYSDGYKYNSSNNSRSVLFSGGLFQPKSLWKINFLIGHQQNDLAWLGVSDSLIDIDRRTNANSKQERDIFFQMLSQLKNSRKLSKNAFIETSIYHTFLKGNYGFDYNNYIGLPSTNELYNYSFESNLLGFYTNYNLSINNFNLITGTHGNIYNRQHIGSEKTIGQLYQNNGYKNEISYFAKLDRTIKMFTFFTDIQYRHVNFDYNGSVSFQKLFWNFINPKVGLSSSISNNSVVYYSAGYTGREPTRNDMFGGSDDLLADSLGNAILFSTKPESVLNHELGIRHQSGKWNFNMNLYYMDFNNEIVLDGKFGPNGIALTNNVEQSYRSGLELNIVYRLAKYLSLINNSSFNYSRITQYNETFSPILTPPVIVNQEVVFTKSNFTFALNGRYQHQAFIDYANQEKVDNYFLCNSRVSYILNKFQFSVFVNNITNAQYFNQGYVDFDGSNRYFVQAPLNYHFSIQYSL